MSRICAWEDEVIDFEVLDIKSEETLMLAHYEEQKQIEPLIAPYIRAMLDI